MKVCQHLYVIGTTLGNKFSKHKYHNDCKHMCLNSKSMLTELCIIGKYDILCNVNLILRYMFNRYDFEFILIKRKTMPTASSVPRRSPIQVLTGLNIA